jgi:hypothetical protein
VLDFLLRFSKSFASFTADGLSHPMVWVLLILGAILVFNGSFSISDLDSFRLRILSVGGFLIWSALIVGSTFAYPAWHQSMGMYVLLLPLAFGLGVSNRFKFQKKTLVSAFIIVSFLMTAVFLRIGIMGVNRSLDWDTNFQKNICLLKLDQKASLLGAEIQYPPFNLGVEDVNTWEWMRNKYVGWISAIPNEIKCD